MLINTKHFGEIEIDDEKIIFFPQGVPGFENVKKFTILDSDIEDSPFKWLQGIDEPQLTFVIMDPFTFKNNYDIEIDDNILKEIGIESPQDMAIFSIVVIPDDMSKISVNLKAPVIVNVTERKGLQVILDTDKYSVRHYILEELNTREVDADANISEEKRPVNCAK